MGDIPSRWSNMKYGADGNHPAARDLVSPNQGLSGPPHLRVCDQIKTRAPRLTPFAAIGLDARGGDIRRSLAIAGHFVAAGQPRDFLALERSDGAMIENGGTLRRACQSATLNDESAKSRAPCVNYPF